MFLSSFFGYALGWFLYVGALPHPVSFLRQKPGDFFGRLNILSFVGAAISRPKTSETELPVEWNKLTLLPFNQAC